MCSGGFIVLDRIKIDRSIQNAQVIQNSRSLRSFSRPEKSRNGDRGEQGDNGDDDHDFNERESTAFVICIQFHEQDISDSLPKSSDGAEIPRQGPVLFCRGKQYSERMRELLALLQPAARFGMKSGRVFEI